jgi:hypothetical protein
MIVSNYSQLCLPTPLMSSSVEFEFSHKIKGLRPYAQGAVDAILFLDSCRLLGTTQRIYNMADVVRAGSLTSVLDLPPEERRD